MTKISEIMTPKCEWVSADTSVQDIAKKMKENDCGFVPVGENDKLIGIVTDRDIAIRCAAEGKNPATCTARDIMTAKTYYCYEYQDANDVCSNMADIKVRRLPVVDRNKRLVGVISMGDLAQHLKFQQTGECLKDITEENTTRRAA